MKQLGLRPSGAGSLTGERPERISFPESHAKRSSLAFEQLSPFAKRRLDIFPNPRLPMMPYRFRVPSTRRTKRRKKAFSRYSRHRERMIDIQHSMNKDSSREDGVCLDHRPTTPGMEILLQLGRPAAISQTVSSHETGTKNWLAV